jgi:GNAT superfamily N-acetyltransferase
MMYAVRPMRPDDISVMVASGREFHHRSAYSHMAYDAERVGQVWKAALQRPDMCFLQVIACRDEPVGLLFAVLSPMFFGPDKTASDCAFFVAPEHHGKCGWQLLEITRKYREWAVAGGAKMVTLGCSTQLRAEDTAKVFERMGFPQTGSLHAVGLN